MSLQRLPPEIVLHILRLLSSTFFRQDTRRLLVSKWWYQLAQPVLLQDLDLSTASLQRFVLASQRPGVVRSIQNHVITVTLGLDGFENWHSLQLRSRTQLEWLEWSGIDLHALNTWTSKLNGCLAALAGILQQCTSLQSLRFQARPEHHDPRVGLQRRDYLLASPLASLVSIAHLTCLEVDTAGTRLIRQNDAPGVHLCDDINAMLPTLRRLRCRMSSICPRILDGAGKAPLGRLEDVVINLSISETSLLDTSYHYASHCAHIAGDGFPRLKADMELRAEELVYTMSNPRIVRIVSHTFPGPELHSFDAVRGFRMLLASSAPWDADGEVVEESAIHQDLFGSDSSSQEFLL